MGMTAEESAIFYSIGIGDGSWGAFYDICSLYPIRTAIFGFSSHLQLIHGRVNPDGTPIPSPYLNAPEVVDSKGLKFNKPHYIGLASLAESLLFIKPTETQESLYEHFDKTRIRITHQQFSNETGKTKKRANPSSLHLASHSIKNHKLIFYRLRLSGNDATFMDNRDADSS